MLPGEARDFKVAVAFSTTAIVLLVPSVIEAIVIGAGSVMMPLAWLRL